MGLYTVRMIDLRARIRMLISARGLLLRHGYGRLRWRLSIGARRTLVFSFDLRSILGRAMVGYYRCACSYRTKFKRLGQAQWIYTT